MPTSAATNTGTNEKRRKEMPIAHLVVERDLSIACTHVSTSHSGRAGGQTWLETTERGTESSDEFSFSFLRRSFDVSLGVEDFEVEEDEIEHPSRRMNGERDRDCRRIEYRIEGVPAVHASLSEELAGRIEERY